MSNQINSSAPVADSQGNRKPSSLLDPTINREDLPLVIEYYGQKTPVPPIVRRNHYYATPNPGMTYTPGQELHFLALMEHNPSFQQHQAMLQTYNDMGLEWEMQGMPRTRFHRNGRDLIMGARHAVPGFDEQFQVVSALKPGEPESQRKLGVMLCNTTYVPNSITLPVNDHRMSIERAFQIIHEEDYDEVGIEISINSAWEWEQAHDTTGIRYTESMVKYIGTIGLMTRAPDTHERFAKMDPNAVAATINLEFTPQWKHGLHILKTFVDFKLSPCKTKWEFYHKGGSTVPFAYLLKKMKEKKNDYLYDAFGRVTATCLRIFKRHLGWKESFKLRTMSTEELGTIYHMTLPRGPTAKPFNKDTFLEIMVERGDETVEDLERKIDAAVKLQSEANREYLMDTTNTIFRKRLDGFTHALTKLKEKLAEKKSLEEAQRMVWASQGNSIENIPGQDAPINVIGETPGNPENESAQSEIARNELRITYDQNPSDDLYSEDLEDIQQIMEQPDQEIIEEEPAEEEPVEEPEVKVQPNIALQIAAPEKKAKTNTKTKKVLDVVIPEKKEQEIIYPLPRKQTATQMLAHVEAEKKKRAPPVKKQPSKRAAKQETKDKTKGKKKNPATWKKDHTNVPESEDDEVYEGGSSDSGADAEDYVSDEQPQHQDIVYDELLKKFNQGGPSFTYGITFTKDKPNYEEIGVHTITANKLDHLWDGAWSLSLTEWMDKEDQTVYYYSAFSLHHPYWTDGYRRHLTTAKTPAVIKDKGLVGKWETTVVELECPWEGLVSFDFERRNSQCGRTYIISKEGLCQKWQRENRFEPYKYE